MNLEIPQPLPEYIATSNAHDVDGVLACFSETATVRDENETVHGKAAIKQWILKTIQKYQFRFEPLKMHQDEDEIILAIKVSGTFPGSPITLDYSFMIHEGRIASLEIE